MNNVSILDAAIQYARIGWKVFPVTKHKRPLTDNGFKDATTDVAKIRRWWKKFPEANIGIATGQASKIIVLDVDNKGEGAASTIRKLIQDKGEFPQSIVAQSGGGGFHFYFSMREEETIANATNLFELEGLDVRGDGGYIIVPPSIHDSGNAYLWGDDQDPFTQTLDLRPSFLANGNRRTHRLQLSLQAKIASGKRNVTLTSIAGTLRSLGLDHANILAILLAQNTERCDPPLTDEEVETIAHHISTYPGHNTRDEAAQDIADDALLEFSRTDSGLAEMISFINTGKLRYDHTSGRWYLWHGQYWGVDSKQEVVQRAISAAKLYLQAAMNIEDSETRHGAVRYASRIQNRAKIDASLNLMKSLPVIATVHSEWDANPDIIACQSGVLDLSTGTLRPGMPEDLIAHYLPVDYDAHAACPRWTAFLKEVFNDDQEVISFIQKAVGYSFTGRTDEQCMFVLIGRGSNGKSTFLEVLHALFGNYASAAPFTTFERNRNSSQSNDIAALAGKRLVTSTEPNQGVVLDESRIKSLTGGDTISARFLHQEYFSFRATGKIWLGVNHLPRVRDDSDGFWRRVRRIDFPNRFWSPSDNPPQGAKLQDPDLLPELKRELPGILNWALTGARAWFKEGLKAPKSVASATQTYRDDSDPLYVFLQTCCTEVSDSIEDIDDLYKAYQADSDFRGLRRYDILSITRFAERLRATYMRSDENGKQGIIGLKLNDSARGRTDSFALPQVKIRMKK